MRRMTVMRFDARLRRLTEAFPIRFAPGSVEIGRDDTFWTRGSGIAFLHRETHSAAWLMKAPQ